MKYFVYLFFICACITLNVLSEEDVLSDKIQQLTQWSLKKPIIRLNNEHFKHYVKASSRNYSMFIMFTALSPQRQCSICKQAYDEFQIVAQSYRYSNAFSNSVFFGMVDFDDGSDAFQYLKLNTAPVFIYFPPKMKPKKSDYMDLSRSGFSAEQIIKWIHDRADVEIQIYRPPNYSGFLLVILMITMILGLLYVKRDSFKFLFNHIVWGIFIILAILFCISGQIWNSIRGPPFTHRNPQTGQSGIVCYFISGQTWNLINGPPFMPQNKNNMGLFADDSNMQYIAETYIVFLLYFGVSIGVILLNEAPKLKSQTGKRNSFVAAVGIVVVVILFSYLLSIFRSKYQGYPYSFLIK
ncbi:unnamed protein product [Rotaria sordida]|uniref:Magnesium transporter protein 1 n=1 Tax=Rotaria sordida TaxID=392033 RepID=A0A813PIV5_9BILA|nr:unnamed protein product [Rotaria sordida]CAF0782251.1 unnamed protein product [Rotaria sordida]